MLYRRANSPFWWYEFRRNGRKFRGSTQTGDKREAMAVERQRRREAALAVQAAAETEGPPLSWGVAAARFQYELGQHYGNRDTVESCARALVWITTHIGYDTPLAAINDDRIARLVARRRGSGVSPATVNRTVTEVVRKVLRRARLVWHCAVPDIAWQLHLLPEPRPVPRPIDADAQQRLDAAERDDYRPAFRFVEMTGARRIEMVRLTWADVDFGRLEMTLTGKGNRRRMVPMTRAVRDLLWSQRGHHPVHVFTFIAQRTRGDYVAGQRYPITLAGAKIRWRRTKDATGINVRFHDKRHTFAIDLLRATGNLRMVQAALTLSTGVKFKARMIERSLMRAQTRCPRCGKDEALQGALVGAKQHMRMWCLTPRCSMDMME